MQRMISSGAFIKEGEFPFWINRFFHDHHNFPSMHGHDFVELVFVVRGQGKHLFENDTYQLRAGDVFIINPGEVHTYQIEQGHEIEIINCIFLPGLIRDESLRELGITQSMDYYYVHPFLDPKERFYHHLNLRGKDAARILHLMETMMEELNDRLSGFTTVIRLNMVELLLLLSRYYLSRLRKEGRLQIDENELLVRRICGYLERHFDKKLSVSVLSQMHNISERQLNRVFKKTTDMTVLEMIHNIRIEKAKILLSESNEKVISVAGKVGYEDPAFFSRLFRRQVGCPPGKYRESISNQQH